MIHRSSLPFHSSTTLDLDKTRVLFARRAAHHVRLALPVILPLVLSTAAHAQGTMDFSGAQTLMGTFNMRASRVQT